MECIPIYLSFLKKIVMKTAKYVGSEFRQTDKIHSDPIKKDIVGTHQTLLEELLSNASYVYVEKVNQEK